MAKNDLILLDGLIQDEMTRQSSEDKGEIFEYIVLRQILKNFELSDDDIKFGWVDGQNDGGIDGIYIFINGNLLDDEEDIYLPRSNAEIDIYVFTCKHRDSFEQAPIILMLASITEIFNFTIDEASLSGRYNQEIIFIRKIFISCYKKIAMSNSIISFHFIYGSRGDESKIDKLITETAERVCQLTKGYFSKSNATFQFIGSARLIDLYRNQKKFSLELKYTEMSPGENNSYACLVPIDAYSNFVSDETGKIRRYLFDSNVRDYLGENAVNADIVKSLEDLSSPDFWWLNNGITILASSATVVGKIMKLEDVQIVNGLQTTESIFKYFRNPEAKGNGRCVLVRIIASKDASIRDMIIRATNNQSTIESAALRATDKIQRDIEDILFRNQWYYERRKNYYRNIGQPVSRFVTPLYLAAAAYSLILKLPQLSVKVRSKFMRSDSAYAVVFSADTPLPIWVRVVEIFKLVEDCIQKNTSISPIPIRNRPRYRGFIALMFLGKKFGTYTYSMKELQEFTINNTLDSQLIQDIWTFFVQQYSKARGGNVKAPKNDLYLKEIIKEFTKVNDIKNIEVIFRSHGTGNNSSTTTGTVPQFSNQEILEQIDKLLPEQPWKPGMKHGILAKTSLTWEIIDSTISELIRQKRRYRQRFGVVFDHTGQILRYDEKRISADEVAKIPPLGPVEDDFI